MLKRLFYFLGIIGFFVNPVIGQLRSWTRMETMPRSAQARNHPVTFSLDGKGYVTTGNTITNSLFLKDVWRYDPELNSWEELDTFPGLARGYAYGLAYEGKAYLGFGINPEVGFLRDLWEFDPDSEQWTELPSCPCEPRAHPAFLAHKGKLYLAAGGAQSGDLRDFWEYDLKEKMWTQLDTFPGPKRHHPFYFEIGEYVYVGFGHSGPNIYKDMYRYDPANKLWSQVASLPAQGRVAGTQFSYNGKGYLLSGQGEDHQNFRTGEFWEYDPTSNSWTDLPAHPGSGRWAPGSFMIGHKLFLTCGTPDEGDVKDLWMYEFDDLSNSQILMEDPAFLSPNPANQFLYLDHANLDLSFPVVVTDVYGKNEQMILPANGKLDISSLVPGIYIFSVWINGEWKSRKILVSH
ncbi:MAG: T9SS type A sorting domain-containing protein [Saprospiraceae bacterium]|nr:T9SS type A sorting domain-containing protein [Saprospiraceae bacterium]